LSIRNPFFPSLQAAATCGNFNPTPPYKANLFAVFGKAATPYPYLIVIIIFLKWHPFWNAIFRTSKRAIVLRTVKEKQ
jgi:hypothetical protein